MNPTHKANAVQYAEETLGVHVPWDDSQDALERHDQFSNKCETLRGSIRGMKQRIEDRKLEVASEAPSSQGYPLDGVTKQRDFLKQLQAADKELSDLESKLDADQALLDHAEIGRKHQELRLFACTARMTELGGLLQFYAVAKAATASSPEEVPSVPQSADAAPPRAPFVQGGVFGAPKASSRAPFS